MNRDQIPKPPVIDILIKGGTLLTMDNALSIKENALIGILDGKILFAESIADAKILSDLNALDVINAENCLILPGLINTHTHAPMVAFRGMADDLSLSQWLNEHIFPAERQYVHEDMVFHGAVLAMAEMILSGTTTCADGYFLEDQVARAAEHMGMRAIAAEGFLDVEPPDDGMLRTYLRKAEKFIRPWIDSPLVTPAIFCHSPYTCSARTLQRLKEFANSNNLLYFIHVAETKEEVTKIPNDHGTSSIRYLNRLGVLDENTVAVHCVWVDTDDIRILFDRGVKVSHTPESNMKLASGIAPVVQMLKAGVTVGLGTDGPAGNNDHDMILEMSTAAKLHKVAELDPTALSDVTALWMATRGGAKTLGLDSLIGSIERGKLADLILIDTRRPHLTPLYNPYSQIVYSANGNDVATTIINGKIIMRDRYLINNLEPSLFNVKSIAEKIKGA